MKHISIAGGRIFIGTSGWHYLHWRGPFYPEKLPVEDFLSYYSRRFSTVEKITAFTTYPKAVHLPAGATLYQTPFSFL